MELEFEPTKKQFKAWEYLNDGETTELGYGGGAGGGKSWLGCFWQASMREAHKGTRGLLGRRELKNLKRTTITTFFKMADYYGWVAEKHFTYKERSGIIEWHNGGEILLMDLGWMPSDPLYLRLGGLELTDGFVDESNEVKPMAIEILKTRIGRQLNEEYGLIPKLLETFNPDKGHVYTRYYKPFKDKNSPRHRRFIPALSKDNPHLPKSYIKQLENADEITKQRLLFGNFDYDDDPAVLLDHDVILDLFTNTAEESEEKFISCDVARMGQDKTVIAYWEGLQCKKIDTYAKTKVNETIDFLNACCRKYGVRRSNVVVDEDGLGGGVVDGLEGCRGFVNGSKAIKPMGLTNVPNYSNLKTQCYFEFARLAKNGKMGIEQIEISDKELLIEELGQIKQKDPDKDGKISLIGKDVIKENIGRSPDLSDALMMRMYFEVRGTPILTPIFV